MTHCLHPQLTSCTCCKCSSCFCNCCKRHTPWCLPCCPPRCTPCSSPCCGPKCYTHPCCRCCGRHSVSTPITRNPNPERTIPPPRSCGSPHPYGACNCTPRGGRHLSYCAGCGNGRCSSGFYKYNVC
ncbi:unnamed protein product [Allacma fusca]|uniref:Uncharacterized protein n=1 Tax=Allacma fusca TaxID=39272 RepID=A0A8J2K8V5_9HEXA|nr:unnamed protein product [Allacma fusca]